MKKIAEKYEGRADQKGFSFSLEYKSGEIGRNHSIVAVYSKSSHGTTDFETVIVRKRKKAVCIKGRVISEIGDDYLPSPNEWGNYGWSYPTKEAAMQKAKELETRLAVEE